MKARSRPSRRVSGVSGPSVGTVSSASVEAADNPKTVAQRMTTFTLALAVLFVLAAALSAVFILIKSSEYGVNVPYWDEWDYVAQLKHLHDTGQSWPHLLSARAGEHLIGGQIILSAAGWITTSMNERLVMVWNWFFAFSFCILAAWAAGRELGYKTLAPWVVFGASSFFIFNPAAYQLWLWAHPNIYLIVYYLFIVGVLVIQTSLNPGIKLVLSGVIALFGTFVLSNAVALWILLPLVLTCYDGIHNVLSRRAHLIGFIALLVSAVICYVILGGPPSNPSPSTPQSLFAILLFFLTFLGNFISLSLSPQPLFLARCIGLALIILFGFFLFLEWRLAKPLSRRRVVLIWGFIGILALASAAMVALARTSFGPTYPMEASRYVVASAFVPIAVVVLGAMALEDLICTRPLHLSTYSAVLSMLTVVGFVALAARYQQVRAGEDSMRHMHVMELRGKVAALSVRTLELPWFNQIYPHDHSTFQSMVEFLNDRGWLTPRVWDERFTNSLGGINADRNAGKVDTYAVDADSVRLSGWAYLPDRDERAHAVIITASPRNTPAKLVSVEFTSLPRPDVQAMLGTPESYATGWNASIPLNRFSGTGPLVIHCFAYDAETGHAYGLQESGAIIVPQPLRSTLETSQRAASAH